MNPRLKSSKKWTDFPKEYVKQIEDVFTQNFKTKLGKAQLVVQGRIYPEEIMLRVGISTPGELKQGNFEVSMTYDAKKKDVIDRIYNCVDAAASMMDEYFDKLAKDEDIDFPRTWEECEFEEFKLFLQFTTVNTSLEAQADALLGETFEEMVAEMKESEDALNEAEESEDLSQEAAKGPSMFSGKKKKKDEMH